MEMVSDKPTAPTPGVDLAELLRRRVAELERIQGELRLAEERALDALGYAEDILQTVREPLLVLDSDLRVRSANRSFFDTFRRTPSETIGCHLYELGGREWDVPRLRTLLEDILPEDAHLADFESKPFRNVDYKFVKKMYEIDANKLSVVAFVQDEATKKILQAVYLKLPPPVKKTTN